MMQPDIHLVYSIENDNIYVDNTYIKQLYLEIISPNANQLVLYRWLVFMPDT